MDGRLRPPLWGGDLLRCGPHPSSILMGKPDQDLSHLETLLQVASACRRWGAVFWRVQGEPEGGLSPPDLQSGQLAQPQALASLLATQRWPHPWPWKSAEQALAWGSPCLGITGNAQPGQRAAGLRKGGSCLSADGINMIQHKERGGRALPPGSAPCCHLSGGPRRHLPRGPCGAHGAQAPCHSSLQEHHCLAGCQEQPSPVDRAPGNPTK